MAGKQALWLGVVAVAAGGCFGPSPEARESLAQVEKDGRALDDTLDVLEGRLLGGQAMLQQWAELSRRHQEVSELACGSAVAHTAQMVALQERQLERERRVRRGRYLARQGGVGGPAPAGAKSHPEASPGAELQAAP